MEGVINETPRDLYNKIQEDIEGCKAQYALLKVYEASKIKDITDSLSIICDELKAEVNKDMPADIYRNATKEEVIKSAEDMLNIKSDATFDELIIVGQGLYDRCISEVIRMYAY